ncbi:MAG TPA: GNAT family N-acetyltransferase [Solirubrobacterales bacterium]|jgi:RimJ/RimL family protein N-acetyltransferase|nr:GNAT family N-acetyltransferase [Solirubrobacterales bacterium]
MGGTKKESGGSGLPKAPTLRDDVVELNPSKVYLELLLADAGMDPGFHEYFDLPEDGDEEAIRWVLLPQDTRQPSGFIDLSVFNPAARVLEAGYWLIPGRRRQGLTRAAMELVAEWVRTSTDAAQIQLEIKTENSASRGLAAALGYEHRGSCKPPLPRPQHELRELYSLQIDRSKAAQDPES